MNTGDSIAQRGSRVMLEPATEFLVLARLEGGARRRACAPSRPTATSTPAACRVVWLNDVKPDDSVAWLASLVTGVAGRRRGPRPRRARRR